MGQLHSSGLAGLFLAKPIDKHSHRIYPVFPSFMCIHETVEALKFCHHIFISLYAVAVIRQI